MSAPVELLAIAAHRDDVELTCGGTLIKHARKGSRIGIIDLTAGEMGTRGSAELREREATAAASVLGVSVRENLGLPDAGITNTPETRRLLALASPSSIRQRSPIAHSRSSTRSPIAKTT